MTSAPAPSTRLPSPAAIWAALGTVYIVWGSTYLAIRVIVDSAPPLLSMGTRFLTAAVLLGTYLGLRHGWAVLLVGRRQLASAALVGVLLLAGGNGVVAIAEQTVPSGLAALLIAATPLFLVCLRAAAGDRPRRLTVSGTLLGFAGVAVLARPGSVDDSVQTWGVLLILCASLSWSIGSFISGRLPLPANPWVATVWEMAAGGLLQLLLGAARGEGRGFTLDQVEGQAWLAWGYLVVAGSLVAFSAYVWLLGNAPISLIATYAYVNPIVAVLLGALLLSEPVTAAVLAGGAVVVIGVCLVVSTERPGRTHAPSPADVAGTTSEPTSSTPSRR